MPTRTFTRYQLFTWLPWWFKRYVFFQKNAVLEPLYHFDRVERHQSDSDEKTYGGGKTELTENVNVKN